MKYLNIIYREIKGNINLYNISIQPLIMASKATHELRYSTRTSHGCTLRRINYKSIWCMLRCFNIGEMPNIRFLFHKLFIFKYLTRIFFITIVMRKIHIPKESEIPLLMTKCLFDSLLDLPEFVNIPRKYICFVNFLQMETEKRS
ncbi:hypothetical protein BpHYR1_018838 [Brachionus plicatilis]|uniref:Uncharacterized protein n=1 Tax=Brachionus plicatilis TaxID=10195 RepID=A0A3M7QRT7_BRAPC|nr:hypothetical protein BpHYR1_018838 [Brachionus plicatilis]